MSALPATLPAYVHGTCVAVGARGLLIVGPSGSGKSAFALQMMAAGARLVADDQCLIEEMDGAVTARRPPTLPMAIEARGVGLLAAQCQESAELVAVLDMGAQATERLPERQSCQLGRHMLPRLQNPASAHGPAALYLYLTAGFHD